MEMQDFLHILDRRFSGLADRLADTARVNAAPLALAEDILLDPINALGGYSLLQIGAAAAVVGAGIWGLRVLYQKALGSM